MAKSLVHLNLFQNELQNAKIQNLASDPGTPVTGQVYFNTVDARYKIYNGSVWKTLAHLDEIQSAIEGLAWKDSVQLATTANITLSGEQTIDGVLTSSSRILVKDQGTATQNGIYVTGSGAWTRADDMSTSAEFNQAVVTVESGTANGGTTWRQTAVNPTIGATNIVFTQFGATVPDATTTVKGIVELATTAETEAKTDTVRAVTPSGLATFTRKYSADITASTGATITAGTHGLGATKALQVSIYEDGAPNVLVIADISVADNGDVTWSTVSSLTGHIVIVG